MWKKYLEVEKKDFKQCSNIPSKSIAKLFLLSDIIETLGTIRDIAMNIYYTESTSTGGLNTFFGALKGGQDIILSLKRGGKQKFEQPRRKISYWLNNRF